MKCIYLCPRAPRTSVPVQTAWSPSDLPAGQYVRGSERARDGERRRDGGKKGMRPEGIKMRLFSPGLYTQPHPKLKPRLHHLIISCLLFGPVPDTIVSLAPSLYLLLKDSLWTRYRKDKWYNNLRMNPLSRSPAS